MDYYAIGQRIRKIRKARGFSQEELADKVGISITHMSHIETANTKLSLSVFVDIANALDVQTDTLLGNENQGNVSILTNRILDMLKSCDANQIKIIEEIVRSTKQALDAYY